MRSETLGRLSSAGRTTSLRTILLDLGFDRAGLEQAFGGVLYGEGVRNRDLDGSHEAIPQASGLYAENDADPLQPPAAGLFKP